MPGLFYRYMKQFDVILLPGLRLRPDGSPRHEMGLRVQKAFEVWKETKAPRIIACGADTAGTGVSEAETMKRMLVQKGVPEECVLTEDASFITAENFRNAVSITGPGARAALVTSDYHMPRARLLCKKAGFHVKGFKARTPAGLGKITKRLLEALGILDALCGWQDEGKARPRGVEKFKNFLTRNLRDRGAGSED